MSSMMGNFSGGNSNGLKGSGYKQVTVQGDPRTANLWQQLRGGASPGIGAGLSELSNMVAGNQNQSYWDALEAPARRQHGQEIGQLASRFSGMGSGARRSSGFQNAGGEHATDFAERLQSQRLGLQQSAISQLLGLGSNLLGTNLSDSFLQPKGPSKWQKLLGIGLPIAGAALGSFGGPFGLALGSSIGGSLGSSFSGKGGGNTDFSGISSLPTKWG